MEVQPGRMKEPCVVGTHVRYLSPGRCIRTHGLVRHKRRFWAPGPPTRTLAVLTGGRTERCLATSLASPLGASGASAHATKIACFGIRSRAATILLPLPIHRQTGGLSQRDWATHVRRCTAHHHRQATRVVIRTNPTLGDSADRKLPWRGTRRTEQRDQDRKY